MNIKIKVNKKPPQLSGKTQKLFAEAERAGFSPLGWLTVTLLQPVAVAGFANDDGSIALAFLGSDRDGEFDLQAVDMVSHLEGPKKLTTTTFGFVLPQFERGIFKYSYPKATLSGLLSKHEKHLRDLKARPVLFVKTLAALEKSIREYLAFEEQAGETAVKESLSKRTRAKPASRGRRPKINPKDPFAAVREAETDGANYDLDTEDIIARLKQWQSLCSFRVTGATYDTVDIEFDTLPKDMDGFVRGLYEFCPDLVDQGTGCVQEMLQVMEAAGKKPTREVQKLIEGVDFEDEDYGLKILKRELQQKKSVRLWWD